MGPCPHQAKHPVVMKHPEGARFPRSQTPASVSSQPQLQTGLAGAETPPPPSPPRPARDGQTEAETSLTTPSCCLPQSQECPATPCPRKVSHMVNTSALISSLGMNFCLFGRTLDICSSGKLITSRSFSVLKVFNVYKRAYSSSSGFFVFTVNFSSRPCHMRSTHETLGRRLTSISKVCKSSAGMLDSKLAWAPT